MLRRVATEFVIAQADSKHREDPVAWLVHACKCVARCIVRCFTGDHSKCEQWSRVCTAHTTVDYTPRHLPNGQVVSMTSNDKSVVFFTPYWRVNWARKSCVTISQLTLAKANGSLLIKVIWKALPVRATTLQRQPVGTSSTARALAWMLFELHKLPVQDSRHQLYRARFASARSTPRVGLATLKSSREWSNKKKDQHQHNTARTHTPTC